MSCQVIEWNLKNESQELAGIAKLGLKNEENPAKLKQEKAFFNQLRHRKNL
jgi:hypothetical protein